MYTYYCKDTNCPGHTKSWERCCDMRAFSTGTMTSRKQSKPASNIMQRAVGYQSFKKTVFA